MNQVLTDNPRAVAGDNQAQGAAERVTEYLERDYSSLTAEVDALLEKARDAPREVADDEAATSLGLLVKQLREASARAEAYRETEKAPHRLSADAVDAFFFALRERLARRNPRDRTQKPGAADILQARIDDFLERKRVEEESRRREEEERLAREAAARAEEEAKARRAEEEARLAAERARKPENVAARTAEAEQAAAVANAAAIEAEVAKEKAQEAHIATLAKPADLVRTRGDGVLLTQAKESYAIVVDRTKLEWAKIAPFFTDAEVDKALRGWARTTNFNQQMTGAEIGYRRKGVTR
jgi:hypothetical protein